jgi:hypothetical protein
VLGSAHKSILRTRLTHSHHPTCVILFTPPPPHIQTRLHSRSWVLGCRRFLPPTTFQVTSQVLYFVFVHSPACLRLIRPHSRTLFLACCSLRALLQHARKTSFRDVCFSLREPFRAADCFRTCCALRSSQLLNILFMLVGLRQ